MAIGNIEINTKLFTFYISYILNIIDKVGLSIIKVIQFLMLSGWRASDR